MMKFSRISLVAMHIGGWLIFQSLPLAFILSQAGISNMPVVLGSWQYWMFCMYFMLVFYLHTYLLLPSLHKSSSYWWYAAGMALLLVSVFWLQPFEKLMGITRSIHQHERSLLPPPGGGRPPGPPRHRGPGPMLDIISIILFLTTIVLGVVMDLARRWRETMQRAARAEADKVNAELSFLKAQINPHFLFNTLNNIYSMAVTGNAHTADTIMKLSNIMRYVTDEAHEDFVSLQSEVDCISDYIDLQRLRLGKKVKLGYLVTGELEDKRIAPLILMTFIENVFKYGTSSHEASEILISIRVEDDRILFESSNQRFPVEHKLERAGIGIANTRKRLHHLYPGKHELLITRKNNLFIVHLTLLLY